MASTKRAQTTASMSVLENTKRVADAFFDIENTKRTLLILMNKTIDIDSDPISSVCMRCMHTPFEISLTDKGLAPFRNDPTIVIPYSKMIRSQLEILHTEIESLSNSNLLMFCTQNCSGVYVHTSSVDKYYIDPSNVLMALIEIMHDSTKHSSISTNELISVVIQKLANCAKVPSQAISNARAMHIKKLKAQVQAQSQDDAPDPPPKAENSKVLSHPSQCPQKDCPH